MSCLDTCILLLESGKMVRGLRILEEIHSRACKVSDINEHIFFLVENEPLCLWVDFICYLILC